ncbi:MAG: TatD family hydrolase [Chromatiales bacterium]|jgi:TatD DNase family protein
MGFRARLIDSHAHFDDACFDLDRQAALQRAHAAGVEAQVIPAVKADWWPRIRRLCREHPELYPTYGLHPMYLADHCEAHLEALAQWVEREQPVAIGECGLDFYIDNPQPEQQRHYFAEQLAIARASRLPVIIHARRSVEEVIKTLRQFPGLTGVLHSYSGSEQQAEQLIEMGFYLSFGGPITFERAKRLHRLVSRLPLSAILLETDAPDQPGSLHRGERNEPAYLTEVLEAVSRLRDQSPQHIAEQTRANTCRLFKL